MLHIGICLCYKCYKWKENALLLLTNCYLCCNGNLCTLLQTRFICKYNTKFTYSTSIL